ncbi:MAG: DNA-binding protein WhiA [Clostridia bacterium]|nr:DNA-binding protein WhiA [Clostridia bacterium]
MSVSSEIKDFLSSDGIKRGKCCENAFEAGKAGLPLSELCPACRNHYVAGAFVGGGTVTDPSKDFHLEIKAADNVSAFLKSVLAEEGLEAGECPLRGGKVRLYYKGSSRISDFLTFVGASKFALEFMEYEVMRSVRSKENRRSNAEFANIDRAATAAAEQMRAIALLKEKGALSLLSDELIATARKREENPFMPLGELCKEFSPPISKSGLSHRLKKLVEEADKLK